MSKMAEEEKDLYKDEDEDLLNSDDDDEEEDDDDGLLMDDDDLQAEEELGDVDDDDEELLASSEEEDLEEDEEEEEEEEYDEDTEFYQVQYTFTDRTGKEHQQGEELVVKCLNCALWQKEWAGEVRCDVGKIVSGNECAPDKFSCNSFFWPLDMANLLDEFLNMSLPEAVLVSRMRKGLRNMLGVYPGPKSKEDGYISYLDWIGMWMSKNDLITGDSETDLKPPKVYKNALRFLHNFVHYDMIQYPYEFFASYANLVDKAHQKTLKDRRSGGGFGILDHVEWSDRGNGGRVRGRISKIGGRGQKGKVLIMVDENSPIYANANLRFVLSEWLSDCKPRLLEKAQVPIDM
jgi:hypothetical protein